MRVAAIEARASIRKHNEIGPEKRSCRVATKKLANYLGHTTIAGELEAFELWAKYPKATLKERLQIANLGETFPQ